jgi:hypothetical protein
VQQSLKSQESEVLALKKELKKRKEKYRVLKEIHARTTIEKENLDLVMKEIMGSKQWYPNGQKKEEGSGAKPSNHRSHSQISDLNMLNSELMGFGKGASSKGSQGMKSNTRHFDMSSSDGIVIHFSSTTALHYKFPRKTSGAFPRVLKEAKNRRAIFLWCQIKLKDSGAPKKKKRKERAGPKTKEKTRLAGLIRFLKAETREKRKTKEKKCRGTSKKDSDSPNPI